MLTAAWVASRAFTVAAEGQEALKTPDVADPAQEVLETPDFDVAEALLRYNVALSDVPGLSGVNNASAETGCPIAVSITHRFL